MAVFTQIASFSRPGNIDFEFLSQWEPAIALVAKLDPDNPLFRGKRGSVAWYKAWPAFSTETYRGGTSLYWNSPRLIVFPPEPVEADRALWSAKCTPNWQIFDWTLEVWRVEGLPALEPGAVVDLSAVLQALALLEAQGELALDGLAQLQALTGFLNQGISELSTGQQQLAVAISLLGDRIDQLQLGGGDGGSGFNGNFLGF